MAVRVKNIIESRPAADCDLTTQHREICTRTTWVDADAALQHISKGRASGNRASLWLRSRLQRHLHNLAQLTEKHAGKVLFVVLLVLTSFCVGLKSAALVTDIEKLWVQEGGRLQQELEYVDTHLGRGAGSTKQILIQTSSTPGLDILTSTALLTHLRVLGEAIRVTVDVNDTSWSLNDLCYAPTFPEFENHIVEQVFSHLTPCTIITPLDCFWEGSKLLGPDRPVTIPGLGSGVKWSNLNPAKLVEKIEQTSTIMGKMSPQFSDPFKSFIDFFKRAGITTGYQEKPCLDPLDEDCPLTASNKGSRSPLDIGAELSDGCYGFASTYMHWPEHLIVGSTTKNSTGHIVRGEALQSMVQLMGSKNLYEYWSNDWKVHTIDWTKEKADMVLALWMEKFTQKVTSETERLSLESTSYSLLSFSDATLNALIKNFSQLSVPKVAIGYCAMLVYIIVVLCRPWNYRQAQVTLGVICVVFLSLGVAAGFGFCSLIGLPLSASSTQVLPFLALGLSVRNLFPLLQSARDVNEDYVHQENESATEKRRTQVSAVMQRAGLSVCLSSLCSIIAFLCGAIIPVPALRIMCFQASIILLVNLIVTMLIFPAVLTIDLRRKSAGKADVLCCFDLPAEDKVVSVKMSDATCCLPPGTAYSPHNPNCREDYQIRDTSGDVKLNMNPSVHSLGSTNSLVESVNLSNWVVKYSTKLWHGYITCLTGDRMSAFGVLLLLLSIGGSIYGVTKLKDGLSLTSLVPKDSSEGAFLSTQEKHFSIYHMFAVTKGHFEYPREQKLLHEYYSTFTRIKYILKDDNGGLPDSWLTSFQKWLMGLQKAFDEDWAAGCISVDKWHANASDSGVMAYKLLVQTGHVDHPVDRSLVTQVRLVDEEGVINPRTFYNYLSAWVANDALAYSASQADLRPEPRQWRHDRFNDYDLKIPKSAPIMYAQMPFYLRHLNDTNSVTDMIGQVREICDKFVEKGLPNFPKGVPFTFWEQYIHLRFFLLLSLMAVIVAIFMVISVVLLNLWAAAIIVTFLALLVFQLAGVMGLLGVNLSAAPAVLMVTSVGIGIEFTLHILIGFLTCVGGRKRRITLSMLHMAPSVANAAATTLLTSSMLLFSEFDFIRRCFFYVIASMVILGSFDGLLFLPIILTLIGPPGDITSHAHPDRLPTPTPPASPVQPHKCNRVTENYSVDTPVHYNKRNVRMSGGGIIRDNSGYCSTRKPRSNQHRKEPGIYHQQQPRHLKHHGGSNLSLSTITEESNSIHSSREIVFEPEMVVETKTYNSNDNFSSGGNVTARVTAKVKVELHTPSGSISSSNSGGRKGNRRNSSRRNDSVNRTSRRQSDSENTKRVNRSDSARSNRSDSARTTSESQEVPCDRSNSRTKSTSSDSIKSSVSTDASISTINSYDSNFSSNGSSSDGSSSSVSSGYS